MHKRVLIHRGDGEIRAAFLEDGQLVEYQREKLDDRSIVGNIYRAQVQDVLPGLNAAFIECGTGRNMFLPFMDVRPEAKVLLADDLSEALQEASKVVLPGRIQLKGRRPKPDLKAGPTEAPLKRGDTVICQVVKSGIADKAPRVTTNVTLAGRYLVLLPYPSQSGGVSRKVALGQERFKLKKLLNDLRTDEYSFIVRTAGVGATEEQIRADVDRLRDQWHALIEKFRAMDGPGLVHSDQHILSRLVRDVFTEDVNDILCDDATLTTELREELQDYLPELANNVHHYHDREPIFSRFSVEPQFEKALHRKVWMKSGGFLVIDENEALTSIDVNTGKFTGGRSGGGQTQERTTLKTNLEACEAIAQQIRLRDLGGIIVCDFIDMESHDNRRKVENEFRKFLSLDRAKMSFSGMGDFGLMVLTRKRKNESLQKQVFDECPYCKGEGFILKPEEIWRRIRNELAALCQDPATYSAVVVSVEPSVAQALRTEYAGYVEDFSRAYHAEIIVRAERGIHHEDYQLTGVKRPEGAEVLLPVATGGTHDTFRAVPQWERPERQPAPAVPASSTPSPPRSRKPAAVKQDAPAAPVPDASGEEDAESADEAARKRTRRGRRGGRRRRRNGEDAVENVEQTLAPIETEELIPGEEVSDEDAEETGEAAEAEAPAIKEEHKHPAPPKASVAVPPVDPASKPSSGSQLQILMPYWSGRGRAEASGATGDNRPGRATVPRPVGSATRGRTVSFKDLVALTKEGAVDPAEAIKDLPLRAPKAVQVVRTWGTSLMKPAGVPTSATIDPAAVPNAEEKAEEAEKKSGARRRGKRGSGSTKKAAKKAAAEAAANTPAPAEPAAEESTKRTVAKPARRAASRKAAATKKAADPAEAPAPAKKAEEKPAAKKTAKKATTKKAAAKKSSTKKAATAKAEEKPVAKKAAAKKTAAKKATVKTAAAKKSATKKAATKKAAAKKSSK